jgi:hypothetical protein
MPFDDTLKREPEREWEESPQRKWGWFKHVWLLIILMHILLIPTFLYLVAKIYIKAWRDRIVAWMIGK